MTESYFQSAQAQSVREASSPFSKADSTCNELQLPAAVIHLSKVTPGHQFQGLVWASKGLSHHTKEAAAAGSALPRPRGNV